MVFGVHTVDGGNLAPLLPDPPVAADLSRWMEEILHRPIGLLQTHRLTPTPHPLFNIGDCHDGAVQDVCHWA